MNLENISMHMIERRSMTRFHLDLLAKIIVIDHGKEKYSQNIRTKNICAGGVYFSMENPLPLNTDVKILLYWQPEQFQTTLLEHGKKLIKLTGYVVRSEEKGIAIGFKKNFKFM